MSLQKVRQLVSLLMLASFAGSSQGTVSQLPVFSKVPNLHPGDSSSITNLINTGIKIKEGRVIAWFPKDSLPKSRMKKIADTLNIGIRAAEKFIKAPHSWQVQHKNIPYTFYFRTDSFISHSSHAGFVSIPFWRIKEGKSPWLHEAMHEMLNTKTGNWFDPSVSEKQWVENMPLWLFEGLPDYISMVVSQKNNLPLFDVFTNTTVTNIDSVCKEDLKNVYADYILSFIGKKGTLPELYGKERRLFAPAFYHFSCSFVKYLAEHFGLDALLTSMSLFLKEQDELKNRISPSLEELKKSWVAKIKSR